MRIIVERRTWSTQLVNDQEEEIAQYSEPIAHKYYNTTSIGGTLLLTNQIILDTHIALTLSCQNGTFCFESVVLLVYFLQNQNPAKYLGDLAKMAAPVFPTFDRVAPCVFQARAAAAWRGEEGLHPS